MNLNTTRRSFLSLAGKGLGLAALAVPSIGALLKKLRRQLKVSRISHPNKRRWMKTTGRSSKTPSPSLAES